MPYDDGSAVAELCGGFLPLTYMSSNFAESHGVLGKFL